jgi:hypothetical protein
VRHAEADSDGKRRSLLMSEIVWEDPPEPQTGANAGKWRPIFEKVMTEPGRWARIASGKRPSMSNLASSIRLRRINVPEGRWSVVTRKIGDEYILYVRYDGEEA